MASRAFRPLTTSSSEAPWERGRVRSRVKLGLEVGLGLRLEVKGDRMSGGLRTTCKVTVIVRNGVWGSGSGRARGRVTV